LTINHLFKYADISIMFDNTALMRIVKDILNKPFIKKFSDLNFLIGRVMASITASLRFPGQLNMDLMEIAHNLVALPETKFIIPSIAPLTKEEVENSTELDLLERCFDPSHYMVSCSSLGEIISSVLMFRGNVSLDDIYNIINEIRATIKFAPRVPADLGLKYGVSEGKPIEYEKEVTLLTNTTAIAESFQRILDNFDALFEKNWYISHYEKYGVSKEYMEKARANFKRIIDTYLNLEFEGNREES
ncbi:MAG: hypothetical protein ACTSPL_07450, partial [Candidatus Odinarchaeia archaeon]